ncbi:hypothetical protein [Planomicrobium sp. CPCC 101110]|nr:hypothetical protein [Planomicrobium sp. CPCC 101110]
MKKKNDGHSKILLGILETALRLFVGLLIVSGILYAAAGVYYTITYLMF